MHPPSTTLREAIGHSAEKVQTCLLFGQQLGLRRMSKPRIQYFSRARQTSAPGSAGTNRVLSKANRFNRPHQAHVKLGYALKRPSGLIQLKTGVEWK
jgi:hypothetical protein